MEAFFRVRAHLDVVPRHGICKEEGEEGGEEEGEVEGRHGEDVGEEV